MRQFEAGLYTIVNLEERRGEKKGGANRQGIERITMKYHEQVDEERGGRGGIVEEG